jgi:hypothetical protein
MAGESGEASAGPNRPDAAGPTGWFRPADGEAAPPFRHGMEPARSDSTADDSAGETAGGTAETSGVDADDRDGAWYQDPQPTSVHQARGLWPWSLQNGSRRVPVVGPTEALHGRAGGPGMAVPQGAVPGLLDPEQRSGWQLAQQVWQESGVPWEPTGTAPHGAEFAGTGFAGAGLAGAGLGGTGLGGTAPPGAEFARAESVVAEPADPVPMGMASASTWFDDPELTGTEPADIEPADPEPAGMASAATWFDDPESDRTDFTRAEPADPEPAVPEPAEVEAADIAPARVESADTWFDGRGPADARLAAGRSVGERPTVVEYIGPYFADSGVVPMQPEFTPAAFPRQPTFTPADSPRTPGRDRVRPGSARDDAVRQAPQRPPRPAPARRSRLRPEPTGEDREQENRIRWGSDQAGRIGPGPVWNEYPPSGFPGQAWPAGGGQVPLSAPVAFEAQAPGPVGMAGFIGADASLLA